MVKPDASRDMDFAEEPISEPFDHRRLDYRLFNAEATSDSTTQLEIPLRKLGPKARVTASGTRRHNAVAIRNSLRWLGAFASARK